MSWPLLGILYPAKGRKVGEGRRCVVGASGGDWEAESSGSVKRKNVSEGPSRKTERREKERGMRCLSLNSK